MSGSAKKFRLVTRSDFDGLVSAILLKELNLLDGIEFVHPKDMQDGKVEITGRDIVTNLPYVSSCHLCFDHHASEEVRNRDAFGTNYVLDASADSAARVVYNYFGGAERFPNISLEMMEAVDCADSARFSRTDILAPTRWVLLSFVMDPRTGLGRFHNYRVSNYNLMLALIDYCRNYPVDDVLRLPDIRERVEVYNAQRELYLQQVARCATVVGHVLVIDLREEETIYSGNRFLPYALYPEVNVSVHVMRGRNNENTVLAIGKSILKRTNPVSVGELCLKYGGGGHSAAGTCQVDHEPSNEILADVVRTLNHQDEELARESERQNSPSEPECVGA